MKSNQIQAGQTYWRTWAGYQVQVEIWQCGANLMELTPSGNVVDPSDMPDATYEPVIPSATPALTIRGGLLR